MTPDGPPGVPTLSLIVPVKDEEAAIGPFLARIVPILGGLGAQEGAGLVVGNPVRR